MTDVGKPPHVPNAQGITWRRLKHGWECRWRARTDLVRDGFTPKIQRLFAPSAEKPEPDAAELAWIADRSRSLQDEMLIWARGGVQAVAVYDRRDVRSLIACYKTDPDSPYHEKRYHTRQHYNTLCRLLERACGNDLIPDIDARRLLALHRQWSEGGKVAIGHSLIGMLRTLMTFGATLLKCPHCRECKTLLHDMRFKMPKRREATVTAEQAVAVRMKAREKRQYSVALAQAFQFDCMFRQKDVIGEWVPMSELGMSLEVDGNRKWLRGIRAEEIDANLILKHVTSKKDKPIEIDLKLAPMVLEEFRFLAGLSPVDALTRAHIPTSGPLIIRETTGRPWTATEFRRAWRAIANECGIPTHVKNMDSRAGAITEATDAGAPLEHVRHAATHSDTKTTQGYSRNQAEKTDNVMRIRAEHRNKGGTK